MSLENFEFAMELISEGKSTFPKLLEIYWESSMITEPKANAAEQFGGLFPESQNLILKKYSATFRG